MLYAMMTTLVVEQAVDLAATSGHFAHALFLDLVSQVDPSLAEALHATAAQKPFTVSPLLEYARDHPLSGRLAAGQRARLRFTVLDDRVFAALLRKFASTAGFRLRAGPAHLVVSDLTTVPGPWTGARSIERIWEEASDASRVALQFATPTSFSLGERDGTRRMGMFPTAALVFGSLRRRWLGLGGPALPADLGQVIDERLVEVGHEVRTLALQMRRQPEIGFIGWCDYEAKGAWTIDQKRAFNALADLAFFTGIGRKTTMGLGQARRLARED